MVADRRREALDLGSRPFRRQPVELGKSSYEAPAPATPREAGGRPGGVGPAPIKGLLDGLLGGAPKSPQGSPDAMSTDSMDSTRATSAGFTFGSSTPRKGASPKHASPRAPAEQRARGLSHRQATSPRAQGELSNGRSTVKLADLQGPGLPGSPSAARKVEQQVQGSYEQQPPGGTKRRGPSWNPSTELVRQTVARCRGQSFAEAQTVTSLAHVAQLVYTAENAARAEVEEIYLQGESAELVARRLLDEDMPQRFLAAHDPAWRDARDGTVDVDAVLDAIGAWECAAARRTVAALCDVLLTKSYARKLELLLARKGPGLPLLYFAANNARVLPPPEGLHFGCRGRVLIPSLGTILIEIGEIRGGQQAAEGVEALIARLHTLSFFMRTTYDWGDYAVVLLGDLFLYDHGAVDATVVEALSAIAWRRGVTLHVTHC